MRTRAAILVFTTTYVASGLAVVPTYAVGASPLHGGRSDLNLVQKNVKVVEDRPHAARREQRKMIQLLRAALDASRPKQASEQLDPQQPAQPPLSSPESALEAGPLPQNSQRHNKAPAKLQDKRRQLSTTSSKEAQVGLARHKTVLTFVPIPNSVGGAIDSIVQLDDGVSFPLGPQALNDKVKMGVAKCKKAFAPLEYVDDMQDNSSGAATLFAARKNFCLTRHPYERAIATYMGTLAATLESASQRSAETTVQEECSPEALNQYLQAKLERIVAGWKYLDECAWLPQHNFVLSSSGRTWCHNIIRRDQLPWGFNELMQRYALPHRVTREQLAAENRCPNITVQSLWLPTRRLLDKVYSQDFKQLGFSKRTEGITFVHIPMNAGMAIKHVSRDWVTSFPVGWSKSTPIPSLPGKGSCVRFLLPPRHMSTEDRAIVDSSESFCVVRHPYDRAVSLYTLLLASPTGVDTSELSGIDLFKKAPCSKAGLNLFWQQALDVYNATGGSIRGQDGTFLLNCQMIPQTHYVFDSNGNKTCNTVMRLDALDAQLAMYMGRQGIASHVTLSKASFPRRTSWRCPHLSKESLQESTKQRIAEVYKDDFKHFGYDP